MPQVTQVADSKLVYFQEIDGIFPLFHTLLVIVVGSEASDKDIGDLVLTGALDKLT